MTHRELGLVMRQYKFIALGILFSATLMSAQTKPVLMGSPTGVEGEALIKGMAVDADARPISDAPVRLRNLDTKEIEQKSTTNAVGEFTFTVKPGIPYVVEIAGKNGRILAVGDVIIAQPGEVVSALLSIAAKVSGGAGLFSDSLGSVISAAAGMGVTAVETTVRPFVSPER